MQIIKSFFELIKTIIDILFGFLKFLLHGFKLGADSKYQGRFLSWYSRIKILNRWNKGLAVDGKKLKLSKEDSTLHCAVIGGTGSFKSTIQYANIMNLRGSKLIIDVDGKGRATTGGDQHKQGYNVCSIDFSNPERSRQINFLDFVHSPSDGKWLAHKFVTTTYMPNSNSNNIFWEHSATTLLSLLINMTKRMEKQFHTMSNVRHLCQNLLTIEPLMAKYCTEELWYEYTAINSMDQKTFAGVQASALVCLDRFADPVVQHLTARTTFSFKEFLTEPTVLYIVIPESEIEQYSGFISIFLESLFHYIIKNKPKDVVYFILDEFAQFSLESYPTLSTVLRRYNCSLTIILQSYSQLVSRFGEAKTRTILYGSSATRIIMPGSDIRLAQELSRTFGRKGVHIDNDKGGYITDREVLSPREIIQMKKGQALFLHRHLPPYLIKRTYPFFKQRSLRRRSKTPLPPAISIPLEKPALIPIPKSPIV